MWIKPREHCLVADLDILCFVFRLKYQWVAHMFCHHLIRGKPFENLGLVWQLARVTYEHAIGWKQKCNNINFAWLGFFDNLQIITKARHSACIAAVYLMIAFVCAQSCPILWDLMHCSPPGFSVHGFSRQAYWSRLLIPTPANLSDPGIQPWDLMCLFCLLLLLF